MIHPADEEKTEALRDAAGNLTDHKDAMVMAACIQYLLMDGEGNEIIGGYYTGGIINAIGLTQQANDELLGAFYEDEND